MLDNRYEILEVIGTGGMAVVFKAKCHRLNRLVAIKMLKRDLSEDAEFRRRFHDESQAVAMLSHPNIMAVYDVSRGGDVDYIVMELIDGITLKQYMERRGRLNWPEALHFITQIMRGLSHAHSRGIVHRDIKPQNIMILRDGTVKVTDFGIACLSNGANPSNEPIGSVHYISPEQAKGDYTDNRSDIYSAGVVLYEMLTSRLPFDGDNPVSIAIQHLNAVPAEPRALNPDIPEALEQICLKAMAPDRGRRYSTADEMLADLETFRRDPSVSFEYSEADLRPTQEQPDDEPTQYLPNPAVTRKNPHYHSPAREAEDEEERPRGRWWLTLLLIVLLAAGGYFGVTYVYRQVMSSFTTTEVPEYKVPNLEGKTIEEAEQMPEVAGIFEIVEDAAHEYSAEFEAGQIIRQSPKPDKIEKSASGDLIPINVTVSLGLRTDVMPNLIGTEGRSAKLMLTQNDSYSVLKLNVVEGDSEYDDAVPVGCVARTEPQQGAVLSEGDTVTLYLSMGPKIKYVTMISCLDGTVEQTQTQMDGLGLVAEFEKVEGSQPEGTILSQSIDAGASVAEGTTVTFTYSDGLKELKSLISFEVPYNEEDVLVEMYLDDTLIFESDLPGDYSSVNGPLEVPVFAVAGDYRLQIFVGGAICVDKVITFSE